MFNLARNRASRGRPHKRLRAMVALADVITDRSYQLSHATEGPSADALVGDFRKKAFHQIQPRSPSRSEVPMIPGVRGKPGLHRRMRVRTIIIQNQMDHQSAWCAALDPLEKTQKLLMAMARHAVAQHLAAQDVQGRKQSSRPVASVIV